MKARTFINKNNSRSAFRGMSEGERATLELGIKIEKIANSIHDFCLNSYSYNPRI